MLEFTYYEFFGMLGSFGAACFGIGFKFGSPKTATNHKANCTTKGNSLPPIYFKNRVLKQSNIILFKLGTKTMDVDCPFYENKTCTATGEKCIKL